MAVGQTSGGGTALMLLSTNRPVPTEVLDKLGDTPSILEIHSIAGA
jgi:hypothetical protein